MCSHAPANHATHPEHSGSLSSLGQRLNLVYDRCFETSLVISNMSTTALPPKTFLRLASATMLRLALGSWRLFFLMYTHRALTTSERAIGPLPTTSANSGLIFMGFINAEFAFAIVLLYSPIN